MLVAKYSPRGQLLQCSAHKVKWKSAGPSVAGAGNQALAMFHVRIWSAHLSTGVSAGHSLIDCRPSLAAVAFGSDGAEGCCALPLVSIGRGDAGVGVDARRD